MEIKVEAKHLFKTQFNTVPIKRISENSIRIFMSYIDYIIDDERFI